MKAILSFLLLFVFFSGSSQTDLLDSLQKVLHTAGSQEQEIDILNKISFAYAQFSLKREEEFALEALEKAQNIGYKSGIAVAYNNLGICNSVQGRYTTGLDYFIKALRIREEIKEYSSAANTLNNMTRVFILQKDYEKAIEYSEQSLTLLSTIDAPTASGSANVILGSIYAAKGEPEQAIRSYNTALDIFKRGDFKPQQGWALLKIAGALETQQKYDEALAACFRSEKLLKLEDDVFTTIELYQQIGLIYTGLQNQAAASRYLHRAMLLADEHSDSNGKITSRLKLSEMFKRLGQCDSALYFHEAYSKLSAEIFTADKVSQLATLEKIYQTEKKDQLLELNRQKIETQSVIIVAISIFLAVIVLVTLVFYRNAKERKKVNADLTSLNSQNAEKNEEIMAQAEELQEANEQIRVINENLEREVALRTEKIKVQNETLIEYAYFNAHNVRGPLARILGLAMLMERETALEPILNYNRLINLSAKELDKVVKEINERLTNA